MNRLVVSLTLIGFGVLAAIAHQRGAGSCALASASTGEVVTSPGYTYAYGLAAGDLNGDGKIDITVADAWNTYHDKAGKRRGGRLLALMNDGSKLTETVIADPVMGDGKSALIERHAIADITGDGRLDIVAGLIHQDEIVWFENLGAGWREHRIPNVYKPVEIAIADLDRDGEQEIIVASFREGGVRILSRNGAIWKQTPVSKTPMEDTRMLKVADIDGDGLLDIVASSRSLGRVVWYKSPDWREHVIADHVSLPWHGDVADMNADGKPDVIVPSGGISWYENPTWTRHDMVPKCSDRDTFFEVKMADLNGDGAPDFVASLWPHNDHSRGAIVRGIDRDGGYEVEPLVTGWGLVNSVLVAPLFGRADIVASTEQPHNQVRLWRDVSRVPSN